MKKILITLSLILPLVCTSQVDTLKYTKVIDFDGNRVRYYDVKGYWVLSNDTLVNYYEDGELVKNLISVKDNLYIYKNDFGEEVHVVLMDNRRLKVMNQSHKPEYNIYY